MDLTQVQAALFEASCPAEALTELISAGGRKLYGFQVPILDAPQRWKHIRSACHSKGLYPLIVDELGTLSEVLDDEPPPAEIVASARMLDASALLAQWAEGHELAGRPPGKFDPNAEAYDESNVLYLLRQRRAKSVAIALLPTSTPWEAIAFVGCANSHNYDIGPAEHVAIHRDWFERFGAEPMAASADMIDLAVARPANDKAAAIALALEHASYCIDIVDQGVGSVAALASHLKGATVWGFWWD